jgi:glucokinase
MDQLEEVLALDLGGSKLALARVDRAGELLAHTRAPTAGIRGGDDLVAWVRAEVGAWGVDPRALGISAGGPLDDEAGIIVSWPRMEMLWGYPLAASLRAAVPSLERVALVNDASAACAGEVLFGAAVGLRRVLYLTISTGIGGGAVVGGRLLRGDRGNAAEFGHTVVKHDGPRCDCGGPGHLEAMASAAGLYHRYVAAGLCEASERGWAGLGPWLRERLEGGDERVMPIWDEGLAGLATGIVNLYNCFAPQAIVLGGGLSTLVSDWSARLAELVDERATLMPIPSGVVRFSENRHTIPLLGVAGVAGGWIGVEE